MDSNKIAERAIPRMAKRREGGHTTVTELSITGPPATKPWKQHRLVSAHTAASPRPSARLQERNTYRQSLIEYEQAKRGYYGLEDGIWQLMRSQIRQLQVNRVTFEYGRQAVRIAATQLELNEDIRQLRDDRGLASGPTAARDTIQALGDLLNAQNALLNIYVNYEVVRRGLDLDLGTMELTPEGLWIDPGTIDTTYLLSLPGTTIEGVPGGDCSNCGIRIKNQPQPPDYQGVLINDSSLLEINQVDYEQPQQ